MPEYGVSFVGSLGNLAQWDSAIKNTVNSNAAAIQAANSKIFQGLGKIEPFQNDKAGLFYKNLKTQIDSVNKTAVLSGQLVRQVVTGYTTEIDKITKRAKVKPLFDEQYHANFKQTISDLDAFQAAQLKIAGTEQQILQHQRITAQDQAILRNNEIRYLEKKKGLTAQLQKQQTASQEFLDYDRARRDLKNTPQTITAPAGYRYPSNYAGTYVDKNGVTRSLAGRQAAAGTPNVPNPQYAVNDAAVTRTKAALDAITGATEAAMSRVDKSVAKGRRAFDQLAISGEKAAAKLRAANPAYAARDAAITATPPIQRDLAQALSRFPDLQRNLLKQGLGNGVSPGDAAGFQKALADQEAQVTRYTKNMRTGITNIQGSFHDAQGVLNTFTADIDKQGKVIGRWGGNLAGGGTYLKQTVRDFQKVVQWTVATTLVFGTLAATVSQLKNINELNTDLTRLSITAQTTAQETQELFKGLGQVAIDTATPLKEIVDIADDVALATREAGQSTDEWREKIISLTTAVGIYTNLTGVDTVEATDQLSAAFKQLDIAPNELVGVLSKVSAVAGGQSQAIADITKSLAGLSEAAKAAGFTLDQEIASVQVLSQVTNKSADEIATSFKNLFGSISSVGSVKILKSFGIEVRDATGGVRDFLDIYHDIADALAKGIIPQNRLPDVLRGISGGPRRAPDAAAFLSNLGRIDEVVGKSVGATNEALIANAKILDTNAAKITQLQNTIDLKVFQQLNQTVQDLVDLLTKLGTIAANAFGAVPPQVLSMGIQLGIVLVAMKSLVGLSKLVGASLLASFSDATKGVELFNVAVSSSGLVTPRGAPIPRSPAVTGGKLAGLKNFLGGKGGKFAAGAGIAAVGAAGLAGGGVGIGDIGSIIQAVGGIATFVPGLQAAGIAALAVGTGLQFLGSQGETAKKSTAELSKEIYTLTQNLGTTQDAAKGYADAQKEALASITQLNSIQKKTAADQSALSASIDSYVTNTLAWSAANKEVAKSFDEILAKLPGLENFKQYAITSPDSPGIKKLLVDLSKQLLEGAGQQISNTSNPITYATALRRSTGNSTTVTGTGFSAPKNFDLSKLEINPRDLNNLVNDKGQFRFDNAQNLSPVAIGYLKNALQDIITQGPEASGLSAERIQQLIDAVQGLSVAMSSYDQNILALTQQNAQISSKVALGIFTQDQGKQATTATGLIAALTESSKNVNLGSEYGTKAFASTIPGLIDSLSASANAGEQLPTARLVEVGKTLLQASDQYQNIVKLGDEAINRGIVGELEQAGIAGEDLDNVMKSLGLNTQVAADAAKAYAEELAKANADAKVSARDTFAQRSLALITAKNSGQYDKNASGLKVLQQQNVQAYHSTLQLIDSLSQLSETSFVDLANALSQVTGLTNLYVDANTFSAETDQEKAQTVETMGAKLIEAGVAAGLNADQIKALTAKVLELGAAVATLPDYKKITIEIQTINESFDSNGGKDPRGLKKQAQLRDQLAQQKAADPLAEFRKYVEKLFNSGKGSSLGQLSKASKAKAAAGAAPQVGLLDIPDEIKSSGNYQALLQTAIKNARNLQSLVPGEAKKNKTDIVELLDGTKRVLETRGIGEEYLRRALDELTGQIKKQNDLLSKADTIRRIRVGAGDFSALANVPVNSQSGVSVGGPNGPVNVTLNINGTVLTPAQFSQFADLIAASIKQQLTN